MVKYCNYCNLYKILAPYGYVNGLFELEVSNPANAWPNRRNLASGQSTMFFSNVSLSPLPNPCINSHFQPPIYEFGDFKIRKNFLRDNDTGPYPPWNGTIDFRMSDIANNYTLYCHWGYQNYEDSTNYENDNCVPENGIPAPDFRTVTLLSLDQQAIMQNNLSLSSPIKVAQFWYCDIVNGSYPYVPT